MTAVVKANSAADFIALLPTMLGYTPSEAIVVVAFRGNRAVGALRYDISMLDVEYHFPSIIAPITRIDGVDGVVVVVYTGGEIRGNMLPRQEDLLSLLRFIEHGYGLRVKDVIVTTPYGYGSVLDPDLPESGRPASDIRDSEAGHIVEQNNLGTSTDSLPLDTSATLPDVSSQLRRAYTAAIGAGFGHEAQLVADVMKLRTPEPLTGKRLATASLMLSRPATRDVFTAAMGWGFDALYDAMLVAQDRIKPEETVFGGVIAGKGPRPDEEAIEHGITLATYVAALTEDDSITHYNALVTVGWFNWAIGRSSMAAAWFERANLHPQEYTDFAELMLAVLNAGALPDWAFDVPAIDPSTVTRFN